MASPLDLKLLKIYHHRLWHLQFVPAQPRPGLSPVPDRLCLLVELVDVDLDVVQVRLDRSEGKQEPLRQFVRVVPLQRHADVEHEVPEEAVTVPQAVRRELSKVMGVDRDLEVPLALVLGEVTRLVHHERLPVTLPDGCAHHHR